MRYKMKGAGVSKDPGPCPYCGRPGMNFPLHGATCNGIPQKIKK